MQYLQQENSSINPKQKENLVVQIELLLTQLKEKQRLQVKERLAIEETKNCNDTGSEIVQKCCKGQCEKDFLQGIFLGKNGLGAGQGFCVGEGGQKISSEQGYCVGEGGQKISTGQECSVWADEHMIKECRKENCQNPECTCTKSINCKRLNEGEQHHALNNSLRDNECPSQLHTKTFSTRTPSLLFLELTDLWERCAAIACLLGLESYELEEIKKWYK